MILKKLFAVMTAAVLAVCAAGCGKDSGKTTKHYMAADYELSDPSVLDDWQINVLKEKGLPTDYNKLKIGQRDSIYRMGVMHRYLVDKYGIEFEYAGYYQSGFGQKEELIVMPEGADENDSRSIVSVRVKNGEFSDNYGDYEVLMYIENMYEEHAKEFFKSDKFKAIAVDVNDNQLGYSHFDEDENFHNDLGISAAVIISDEICDREKCEEYAEDLRKYLCERKLVGTTRISVLTNVDVSKINYNNMIDFFHDNYIIDLDLRRLSNEKTDILYLHEDKHIYYDEKGNIIDK